MTVSFLTGYARSRGLHDGYANKMKPFYHVPDGTMTRGTSASCLADSGFSLLVVFDY